MVSSKSGNSNANKDINLIELNPDQQGTVVRINAGRRAVQRLSGLGIVPGTTIKKLSQAPFRGPVQIQVRGSRLALGRGLALKIIVQIS